MSRNKASERSDLIGCLGSITYLTHVYSVPAATRLRSWPAHWLWSRDKYPHENPQTAVRNKTHIIQPLQELFCYFSFKVVELCDEWGGAESRGNGARPVE